MAANKRLITILFSFILAFPIFAENGINSPYSRYGLGILSNQSLGVNRQLGGLGYALRSSSYINLSNPASFTAIDSLAMLIEAGFSLQYGNFNERGKSVNAYNASFDHIALKFRLCKGLGLSAGFLPYSKVGYSFANSSNMNGDENAKSTNSYSGSGGIYQPFIGLGWSPFKNFSIGAMVSYLYGDISHSITSTIVNNADALNRVRNYTIGVSNYKLDFGMQYVAQFNKKNSLTLGATYSLGHDINANATKTDYTLENGQIDESSKKIATIANGFKLPHIFGGGLWYNIDDRWLFGADYTYQMWRTSTFFGDGNDGTNRSKVSAGIEYSPNIISRNLLKTMSYRAGVYYAQPYTKINGKEGCTEYGASLGISIPIRNDYNVNSLIHISGEYVHVNPGATGMIKENYLRLNIGITFNESWFMKMKVK